MHRTRDETDRLYVETSSSLRHAQLKSFEQRALVKIEEVVVRFTCKSRAYCTS